MAEQISQGYGALYRKMREAKHIPLYAAAGDALSTAQLSRFETGKSEISVTKLFALLENINASPEEYAYMLRDYNMDYNTVFFAQALRYEKNLDYAKLRGLYRSAIHKFSQTRKAVYRLNGLYIKSILSVHEQPERLDASEKKYVVDFLENSYGWGQYELHIFIGCCLQIDYQTSLQFAKNMMDQTKFYLHVPANQELICVMLKAVAIRAINEHDFKNASKLIDIFGESAKIIWNVYVAKQEQRTLLAVLYEEQERFAEAIEVLSALVQTQEEFGATGPIYEANKKELEELQAKVQR
jgi:Rgg/GadR/MutR family transcriptional activator